MSFGAATAWWIVAGGLVALELASGTFYLLMLALGAAAAAVSAHLGLGFAAQLLTAALVGGCAVVVWHRVRSQRHQQLPASVNPDVNLDIGQAVQVDQWHDDAAQVSYRGAQWQARFVGQAPAAPGRHLIRGIEGSCLLLDR